MVYIMNNIFFLNLLSLFLIACHNNPEKNTSEEHNKIPHDYMFMQRSFPTGKLKNNASKKAIAWRKARQQIQPALWEFVGPENVGGRITDVEIPINKSQVYYVGTASGGIFKTVNGGVTWNPIFDDTESLSIGDLELSKIDTNVIWAGTGEVNGGGGSIVYEGNGIYKSSDGGNKWSHKGLSNTGSISKILIDPNDESTVYASAMGSLFKNDSNRGVYKTTDNGSSWEKVLFISDSTGVIDMANHPTKSNILYAATWERIRRPQYRAYGGKTSGIYRTTNGGESWVELTNGLPNTANKKGRISIAISQSNPNILYTRYVDSKGNIEGVYRTSNGGDSWIRVNSSQLNNVGFHWWFRGIYVDPLNENTIYNIGFVVQKSTNGGNSWFGAFPGVHVDNHALAFNTLKSNEILLGNDGGVYKSTNSGRSATKINNLPITQFYRFHVDPKNGNKIYGGTQDNNTIRTITGKTNDWRSVYGGDGFQPIVDPNNTNTIYALSQNGDLVKSTNNGSSFSSATRGITSSDRKNWDTAIAMDPKNSRILYYGTQRLWKTTNAAGSWQAISPDLSNGFGGSGGDTFGVITTIDISQINSKFIVVGTDDSNIWVSKNGGANWNKVSSSLPNLWTTKVLTDKNDVNTIYVTFSGYRYGDNLGHIFKSTNAGTTWEDIGSSLPDIPVNDIVKDTFGNLYVATDIGVFASPNEGIKWVSFGQNMPSVVVSDLHIHEPKNILYAATYGRSAYKVSINKDVISTSSIEFNDFDKGIKIYQNTNSKKINILISKPYTKAHIIFYDGIGRLTYQTDISKDNNAISSSNFPSGVYYVKIIIGNNTSVKKLIVK